MTGRVHAFGKMPTVGDFFRLGAPRDFVSVWDGWLQSALLAGQSALGAAWDARYMSAPIWRFSLSAGLAGTAPVMGVLMPSVDRVGRRFPLTLLCPLPQGDPIAAHFANDTYFEALEAIALAALEDDMTRERLEEALETSAAPRPVEASIQGKTASAARTGDLTAGLAAQYVSGLAHRPSLWTTQMGESIHLLICNGLPATGQSVTLFDQPAADRQEGVA